MSNYDEHLRLSRHEIDTVVLTLIAAMASQYDRSNDRGPYSELLDKIQQVLVDQPGSTVETNQTGNRYMQERIELTLRYGTSDTKNPPVLRDGKILTLKNYVPFWRSREKRHRMQSWNAPWVRMSEPFTGKAKIVEDRAVAYYCAVIGFNEDDSVWGHHREIYVPKRDVIQREARHSRRWHRTK